MYVCVCTCITCKFIKCDILISTTATLDSVCGIKALFSDSETTTEPGPPLLPPPPPPPPPGLALEFAVAAAAVYVDFYFDFYYTCLIIF